jgi:hypothetical protein
LTVSGAKLKDRITEAGQVTEIIEEVWLGGLILK